MFTDRRVESVLCRHYEVVSAALKASAEATLFIRAVLACTQSLFADIPHKMNNAKGLGSLLKGMSLTSALVSDTSLDMFRSSTRLMASNKVVSQHVWLWACKVDISARQVFL